jgi:hypothetical protein
MVLALISLWVGFFIGFVLAAVLRGGSRDDVRLPAVVPTRVAFEVNRVRLAGRKATSRNTSNHLETVE